MGDELAISRTIQILFGIITLVFGILIIWNPKLLSYIVGGYLIIVGLFAIFANL